MSVAGPRQAETTPGEWHALALAESRRRRRLRIAVGVVVVLTIAAAAWGLARPRHLVAASSVVTAEPGQDPGTAAFTMNADWRWGILMSITRTYADEVDLSAGTLHVGDLVSRGEYFRSVDADNDGLDLFNQTIPAGTSVTLEARVQPDCENPDFSPEIAFHLPGTLSGRREVLDVVRPSNLQDYADELRMYCLIGLRAEVYGRPIEGRAEAAFKIANGTDHTIEVWTPAFVSGTAVWRASRRRVIAPHTGGFLVVRGAGLDCDEGQQVPWTGGRLRIEGTDEPLAFSSQWCLYGDVD